MLRKLLKYEWRSVARQLLPLYGGVLILSIINHFTLNLDGGSPTLPGDHTGISTELLRVIPMFVYVSLCVALFVITVMAIIQRFYKGLLSEEGYLMFTLPVKPGQLIASKGIIAALLIILGSIVGILSVLFLLGVPDFWNIMHDFPWQEMFSTLPIWPLCIIEGIILIFVATIANLMQIYAAIAIGHLGRRHRVALAIGAYIGINVILTTLTSHLMLFGDATGLFSALRTMLFSTSPSVISQVVLLGLIAANGIILAVFFAITQYILCKRLNLE